MFSLLEIYKKCIKMFCVQNAEFFTIRTGCSYSRHFLKTVTSKARTNYVAELK